MERANRPDLIRTRRRKHERITIEKTIIVVRDQAPLHEGNMKLPPGFSYEDLIESINNRIFFWPGSERGPISYGVRHFERYRAERPVILRLNFKSLLEANPGVEPRLCSYNSGSPRCSNGRKSPRGPNTFIRVSTFEGTPSGVVEITFESPLTIPSDVTIGEHPNGPWQPLRSRRQRS